MREPTDQEILDILAEECAEVIHIISKIRRFGKHDCHPHTGECNQSRLREEILDLVAMIDWMELREMIPPVSAEEIRRHTKMKHDKVRKYLRD